MSSIMLNWVAMISGIVTVLALGGFFLTGQRHAMLRVIGGLAVIICVVAFAMS